MIQAFLVKHAIWPLAQAVTGSKAKAYLREWEATQWLSPEEVAALQLAKLRKTLEHCARNVPFYREEWGKSGFDPRDVKGVEDLKALPILDKAILRERKNDFLAENVRERMRIAKTGGSTGEPLAFPIGSSLWGCATANMARCRRWWGIDIGDRSANFWGHSRYIKARPLDGARKAAAAAKARVLNRIVLSAYDLSDESMERYWRRIEAFRPAFFIGYATSLYVFADFVLRRGLDGRGLRLKGVISTAEVLYEWQEEAINRAFGCPVINEYGMCEAGVIAYSCPRGSMHVLDESCVVEIEPVEGSDSGDIVVTELENPAAPLVRYNTKDMARRVEGMCECGRGLSRITRVEGRAYDIIYAEDGKVVAGALLTHTMKASPKVGKYQIVQRDLGNIDVTYTELAPMESEERDFIVRTIQRHLGAGVNVSLHRADDIPKERSGKHRWLRSMVTREAAAGGGRRP